MWKRQVLLGVPITAALVGIIALLVDGLALIPYQFPNSYYLWVGLVVLALVVGIIGWTRFRNWRRVVSVLSVLLSAVMAFTLVNQQYQYYPTAGAVFGVDAQNQVSLKKLDEVRERAKREHGGQLPTHGFTIEIAIPGARSGFHARDALVWVPPIWIAKSKIKLPVLMLLEGSPGAPEDWTRAAFADQTARNFADKHGGVAPIIVMPDQNGAFSGDTECTNSPRGKAETYLTEDVPNFIRDHFNAKTGVMAIAGLSEGGMCSLMLSLRHPDQFPTFADYSGLSGPTVEESIAPQQTTDLLFHGDTADYERHNPITLLKTHQYPKLAGWFEVGTADHASARRAAHARPAGGAGRNPDLLA